MRGMSLHSGRLLLCLALLCVQACVREEVAETPPAAREVVDERDAGSITDGEERTYTFIVDRPYRIEFSVSRKEMDAAERVLKEIDLESISGKTGETFGLNRNDPDFSLLYWRGIYNRVYNRSRGTVERLAGVIGRIRREQGLNDVQTVYLIARFVQFMKYDLPPGVGIYSPVRTLYEQGKAAVAGTGEQRPDGWNGAGDCDTKSLLMAMLLQACGFRAVVFDSYRYQHAMTGVDCPGADGVSLDFRGVRYYFIESTYPGWNIGQMPQQYGDTGFFYPIDPREDHRGVINVAAAGPDEPISRDGGDADGAVSSQGPSEREPNNSMASADLVSSLVLGGRVNGNDAEDWFLLGGQEGTYASFTLVRGDESDMVMEVYNNGSMVASTGGAGNDSLICSIPGRCHVRVRCLRGGGEYAVYINPGGPVDREPNDSAGMSSEVSGMVIAGSLEGAGDVDWYALKGQEGYNAGYSLRSAPGSGVLFEVFNDGLSAGRSRGGNPLIAEHPGRVTLRVWSDSGRGGWYVITIERNR